MGEICGFMWIQKITPNSANEPAKEAYWISVGRNKPPGTKPGVPIPQGYEDMHWATLSKTCMKLTLNKVREKREYPRLPRCPNDQHGWHLVQLCLADHKAGALHPFVHLGAEPPCFQLLGRLASMRLALPEIYPEVLPAYARLSK